jgi:ADP-heptose:LPS heptosyltransferase
VIGGVDVNAPRVRWLDSGKHATDCYLTALTDPSPRPTRVHRKPFPVERREKGPLVALFNGSNPSGGWKNKRWPTAYLRELTRILVDWANAEVVMVGDVENRDACAKDWEGFRDLRGQLTLSQSADVLAQADVAVGNDTALAHVADAVGTPVVVVWGFTRPEKCRPYNGHSIDVIGMGGGCPRWRSCYTSGAYMECRDNLCMSSIDPARVALNVMAALCKKHGEE